MDRWSVEQLTRMEKGGNGPCKEFFEKQLGAQYKTLTIPQKVCFPVLFIPPIPPGTRFGIP